MTWQIFTGTGTRAHDVTIPPPPPWRNFAEWPNQRARTWRPSAEQVALVNAALVLRRPLLVTGPPGSGKSSLAYAVAAELGLGDVLTWPINSRSTRDEGLYTYDAVGRLRDAMLARQGAPEAPAPPIGDYIRLGPLGTALITSRAQRPRVLLIDEIDKADIDFPNDLLHLLDAGNFEIPEIRRTTTGAERPVTVRTADTIGEVEIRDGRIQAGEFPFVVLTSNGERDLPPAFLRRCLRLDLKTPQGEHLAEILRAHLGEVQKDVQAEVDRLVKDFATRVQDNKVVAIDQLLNAVFLVTRTNCPDGETRNTILKAVMRALEEA